jgi:hypothetical protein
MSAKMNYTWTYYPCDSFPGPESVAAEVLNEIDVVLNWSGTTPPPPPGGGIEEDFESGSLPADWVIEQTNTTATGPTPAYWTVNDYISADFAPFGTYHAGLWWDYGHQDEWLITPEFTCDAGATLNFWTAVYEGSTYLDHYYVKVSTDGGANWTELWDASTLGGNAWNYYNYPYDVNLSAYAGDNIKLAFQAIDGDGQGLWYIWFIDNIVVGSASRSISFDAASLVRMSKSETSDGFMAARDGNTAPIQFHDATGLTMTRPENVNGQNLSVRADDLLWGANWEDPQSSTNGIISTFYGGLDAATMSSDDFIVPAGEEWEVTSISTRGFIQAGIPTPEGFGYTVFANDNGAPGNVLFEDVILGAFDVTMVDLTLNTPFTLTEGTYWIGIYAYYETASTLAEGRWNQYMWNPATTPGNGAMLNDFANLFGMGADGWVTLSSLGITFSSLDFALFGTITTGGGGGGGTFDPGALLGANIYRDGVLIAEMVQGETYTDLSLEPGYYDYCVTFSYEDGAESCPGSTCVLDVLVPEDCVIPRELTAAIDATDPNLIHLLWNQGSGAADWLYYDDGVNVDGIGGPASFSWAVKFDPAQLTEFDGASVTKISIYNRLTSVNTLQIYEGTDAATLLFEQDLTGLTVEAWNEVTLTAPVLLDVTKQLWITVYTTDGASYPAGCGDATGNPNGDLITLDGSLWEHLSDYGLPYTWNLRAFVTDAKGHAAQLNDNTHSNVYKPSDVTLMASGKVNESESATLNTGDASRSFMGYNVYKNGEILVALHPDNFYDDTEFQLGDYCYTVTAEYSVCGESDPSNEACVEVIVGIHGNDAEKVKVYPNPSNNVFNIELTDNISQMVVYNYVGQVVFERNVNKAETIQLFVHNYEAGAYLVKFITSTGESFTKTVVVTH